MMRHTPKTRPLPGDILLAAILPAVLGLAVILLALCGCDVAPVDADTPRATVVEICAPSCFPDLCEAIIEDAVEYADEGRTCEAECQWAAVGCLHDPPLACGECEKVAAECRTLCGIGWTVEP